MKRDGPLSVPVAMFTQDNIIEGSLQWDIKLWDIDEFDSLRAEYTDPNTGYKQETVLATLPFGTTDTPRDVRFPGIADRDHAYHEALYMLAVDRYLRENITFETGLEGYIPTFGDLIVVAHDVPRWSQSGYVVRSEPESNGDYHLWLSEPVTFAEGENYVLMLRDNLGGVLGPYSVSRTADPQQVQITSLTLIDFLEGGETEPMLYMFGITGQVNKHCRVVKIDPQGNEIIRITAVNEDSTIYSFDGLSAPAIEDNDHVPQLPELPVVAAVSITQLNTTVLEVNVSWNAAFGSEYYIVQSSEDGTNYTDVATTTRTSIQFQVRPGALYVRVAGVAFGQGPWAFAVASIGSLAGIDVIQDFDLLDWTVEWLEVLNSLSYDVKVYDNTTPSLPVLKRTTNILMTADRTLSYDLDDAVADGNENRDMLVTVTPKFADADGTPAEQELDNPIPGPPTSPAAAFDSFDSAGDFLYEFTWTVPAEEDLIGLKLWLETSDGFDPDIETPVVDELNSGVGSAGISVSAFVLVTATVPGVSHPIMYWRVGVFDIWGEENSTNLTDQQTIAAVP